jgi:hypothetical protein
MYVCRYGTQLFFLFQLILIGENTDQQQRVDEKSLIWKMSSSSCCTLPKSFFQILEKVFDGGATKILQNNSGIPIVRLKFGCRNPLSLLAGKPQLRPCATIYAVPLSWKHFGIHRVELYTLHYDPNKMKKLIGKDF